MATSEQQRRIKAAQAQMNEQDVAQMFIGPGSNLYYLTGIRAMSSERIYLFHVPAEGTPTLLLPTFERLGAEDSGVQAEIIEWSDADGPDDALAGLLNATRAAGRCAVDDQLWSLFLLQLQASRQGLQWIKASTIMRELRMIKSEAEIAIMKEAAAIADRTLAELTKQRFSGRKETEIASEIQRLLLEGGQDVMQFCIVGSGPNGAKPHHGAGDRVIEPGDAVVLDFGGTYQGYQSDMTRMVLVQGGTPDKDYERVHAIVNEANAAAHRAAKPGVSCGDVDAAARNVIDKAGFGEFFTHRTGHGIGVDVHEDPYIKQRNPELLREGMAFSIEPGIYLEGRFGVRIEDIAIVRESGSENINLSSHQTIIVR